MYAPKRPAAQYRSTSAECCCVIYAVAAKKADRAVCSSCNVSIATSIQAVTVFMLHPGFAPDQNIMLLVVLALTLRALCYYSLLIEVTIQILLEIMPALQTAVGAPYDKTCHYYLQPLVQTIRLTRPHLSFQFLVPFSGFQCDHFLPRACRAHAVASSFNPHSVTCAYGPLMPSSTRMT